MIRISLTGPESTGKSTLAAQLAAHYGTAWVPEYARCYLQQRGPCYELADLEAIARGQLAAEEAAAALGHPVIFCDTDLLVIKVWAEHAFGYCPGWILAELARPRYATTLLLGIDVPWEPDPLREHPHLRYHFYGLYLSELRDQMRPFAEIWGTLEQRLAQSCFLVDELLNPNPCTPSLLRAAAPLSPLTEPS